MPYDKKPRAAKKAAAKKPGKSMPPWMDKAKDAQKKKAVARKAKKKS